MTLNSYIIGISQMTSDKGYISIFLDLGAEISRSAEVGIEQLKAQQLQHLAKA